MSWRIDTVERALEVNIPSEYAAFLDQYGIYDPFGFEVYGIREDLLSLHGTPCVIGATEMLRRDWKLPHRLVVIYDTGFDGTFICLDTADAKVYSWSYHWGATKVADSFDEWFQRDVIEAQKDFEKTRWMSAEDEHGKIISPRGKIIEQALDVTIPNDYAWFLNKYGTYKVGPIQIYGIGDDTKDLDEKTCVIGATRVQRDYYGLPHRFLVLYHYEPEEITVCLDAERGGVYVMEPETEVEKLADTFDWWFAGIQLKESDEDDGEDQEDEEDD